jgi:hypothetical protein
MLGVSDRHRIIRPGPACAPVLSGAGRGDNQQRRMAPGAQHARVRVRAMLRFGCIHVECFMWPLMIKLFDESKEVL